MRSRTNFRLDKDETFANSAVLLTMMTVFAILLLTRGVPLIVPGIFGLAGLASLYTLLIRVYNFTEIQATSEQITTQRTPVPQLQNITKIPTQDIVKITCEETQESIDKEYDTPRFNVIAYMQNGRKQRIISDIIEEYGFYVAQQLENYLEDSHTDYFVEPDTSRLVEDDGDLVDIDTWQDEENNRKQR